MYLWNAAPDGTPIAIALERGSSISGWLAADDAPLETAIVDVVPEAFAGGRGADERLAFRSRSVKPNARGFFQLTGVAPGEYVVTARMSGRSPATVSRVRVAEGREIALADPLLLEPLARVEVAISPPVDPAGKPWHVALHARQFADRSLVPAGRGTVRREGAWTSDALPRGSYRIAIRDAAGATWHRQPVELEAVDARIDVTLASVPVEGIIRAGTRPLEAELRFESEQAAVEMHSDEEGLFFGSLPRDGEWRVRISPARSRQRIHDVQVNVRRDAELAVDLAGETIEGVVIDEAGNPVANAQVQALRRGRMESHGGTDDAGRFAFIGLKPGELSLYAQSRSGESAPVPVTGADPVTLVVRARTAVSGTLTDASGSPVAGALLRYVGAAGKLSDTATGPNGEFQFDAPPGVEAIDMVVVAPGLPVKLVRIDPRRSPVRLSFTGSAGVLRVGLAGAPPWPTINAG
ncbi:MAG TPA: carboxypeptidase-like regulatory domain-containing protein, partial [Thermoanaerobaculia bacterium]|nr:carboxypeptidase-like regulatory domain-containing protein [Thermoanaerobaculia bacterium]